MLGGGGGGDDVDIESQSSQAPPASSLSASTIGDQWKAEIAQLQEDKIKTWERKKAAPMLEKDIARTTRVMKRKSDEMCGSEMIIMWV